MRNPLLYIFTTALAMLFCRVAAQERNAADRIAVNKLDNLIVRTNIKQSLFPEERVYLHFDNSAYYLGEDIWFKAYVISGDNGMPTGISRILYVELVAPEGYVVRTNKYKIKEDGTCSGSFELNQLLLSGYYEIRAYTRYMLNRGKEAVFSRVFPVFDKVHADNWDFKNMLDRKRGFLIDTETDIKRVGLERELEWVDAEQPDADIKFYPEGGHLVDGIVSRVAFEVFAADGINSNRNISVLADGKPLLTAVPVHMGMGSFTFTPKTGTYYTAIMTDGKRKREFELPTIEDEGAVIAVEENDGSIIVNIKNNLASETEMGCAVLHRGKTYFYERYSSGNREMTFAIDKNSLSEGVNRVVLFVDENIPLAERMLFVTHDKVQEGDNGSVRLNVVGNGYNIGNLNLKPYEKINISISREDGKPIEEGSFSVSVSDADNRQKTSYSYNMYTYMLLGSEVKGYIPNAARYFDCNNASRKSELNLLMLTHGWTSYDWNKLSRREAVLEQPIEKGILVKGRYVKKEPDKRFGHLDKMILTNRAGSKVNFNITYNDSVITMYDFKTDANGEFRILTEDFNGKRVAQLKPSDVTYHNTRDCMFAFVLDRYFSPEMRLYHYWERNIGEAMTLEEVKKNNEEMIRLSPFEYLLSNVEVISKKKKEAYYRPPRSEMRLDYLDEWEYAHDVTYLDRKPVWNSTPYHDYTGTAEPRWNTPSAFETQPALSALDLWAMRGSGSSGGNATNKHTGLRSSFVKGMTTKHPAFVNTISAFDVLRSAFWRHNLNWCYWIQSIVVDGRYSSDSVPAIDTEYTKGISPIKMTNFKEIVIRSDENTRKRHQLWETNRNHGAKSYGNYSYSSFYSSFTTRERIEPRNYDADDVPTYDAFLQQINDNNLIPNYVACFIPNKEEDAASSIVPSLAHYSTSRYTMVYGYTESKEFYSPDYSTMQPDSTAGDYRRTLLWIPDATPTKEGKIEFELYNSTQAKRITVDIEGFSDGTYYGNNGNIITRETANGSFADVRRDEVTPIVGINTPDLLTHCFKLTEEARSLYLQEEYQKAFTLFNEAATLGYADAIYSTAVCYLNGYGVEKDSDEAFLNFRKAANLGQEKALHNLAGCYMHGIGTARNDSLALKYYTMSAEQGKAISQAILGHIYMKGEIVEQDSVKGREWFEKAIEKNEPTSLFAVAKIMEAEDSIAGYSKRQLRKRPAIGLLKRAAESGHSEAQYRLAQHFEKGRYVKKSMKKAFKWYMDAANAGHIDAMERIGYCYEKGRGVKKNEPHAAKWYKLSGDGGNEKARLKSEWYDLMHFFED